VSEWDAFPTVEPVASSVWDAFPVAQATNESAGKIAAGMGDQFQSAIPILGGLSHKAGAAIDAAATGIGRTLGIDKIGPADPFSQAEDFATRMRENEAAADAKAKAFEGEHPVASTVAKIGGGVAGIAPAVALAPAAFGVGGASLLPSALAGATTSAGIGAVDAVVRGEDPGKAAVWGAGTGMVAPMIGRAAGALVQGAQKSPAANELAKAAERQGVDFPRVAASESLPVQRSGAALKEIPILGDPIVKASQKAGEQMGDALSRVEQGFGSGSVMNAGEAAKTGLVDWITQGSKAVTSRLYGGVDALVNPAVTRELDATRGMVANIAAQRQAARLPGNGKAIETVLDAVQAPGGLTYDGVKTLRTSVGEMLDSGVLPSDVSKTELKRIYGALSQDLRETVKDAGGPDAVKAFNRANSINTLVSQRRESLAKIIGTEADAAPEKVVDRLVAMAGSNARADLQKLALARKTIGSQRWDEVASAAVSNIGRDAEGAFSPLRFLTAYGKISENGKKLLFGSTGKADLVKALDDISLLSSKAKQLGNYGNPSGTGRVMGGFGALGAIATSPHIAIPSAIGARLSAQYLARSIKPATLKIAQQNPAVRQLLESAVGTGVIGASIANQPRMPLRATQRVPIPIQ
jgi:hypothetical protein